MSALQLNWNKIFEDYYADNTLNVVTFAIKNRNLL